MVNALALNPFTRALARGVWQVRRKLWRIDLTRPRLHTVRGTSLLVLPNVFDGVLIRTGALLTETLSQLDLQNQRVLDLGCGSGIGAVFAAKHGAHVIASDVNPDAARNARLNALLSHLEDKIETRVGDLFETVRGERFELVLFNPPYYHGTARNVADAAWRSPDCFERFLSELPAYLTPQGSARVVLSTDGDILPALERATHLTRRVLLERKFMNETITVYEIRSQSL